ncbi:MAG TPA: ABC transporter ATP-binding protein [Methylomirabilota bacterium]|jgi:ABC-type branched-subunit amino acid transport system ATPase component|nr:ABC transporter ATP-binding protein [Methylomirabilota bacterium]
MSATGPMLELDRVETYRGPAQILRSVSLTLAGGEAVCLVGRNGAGKTTTIDTIMGLLSPRSGSVRFKGREVTRLPAHERARLGIGYAPEDCGIFPDLTVEENFEITAWLGKRAPAETFTVFPEIKTFLGRRGLHLSGGQKKMLAITRALTLQPAVLLLDEPFEGLAPVVVTRFIEAVRAIKALGVAVLIAESHVQNAGRIADRLYAIDRGEIIFSGRPAELLGNTEVMRTLHG